MDDVRRPMTATVPANTAAPQNTEEEEIDWEAEGINIFG
jgi:hypothetical protein